MVKYLQDLRFLLWLLCRKECIWDGILNPSGLPRSGLISEAQLVSSWNDARLIDIPRSLRDVKFKLENNHIWDPILRFLCPICLWIIHGDNRTSEDPRVTTKADPLVKSTSALLFSINKWLDMILETIRSIKNLLTRWPLASLDFLMEDELERERSQVRQALFQEVCVNNEKEETL